MSIQAIALQKAIAFLKASNVEYIIKNGDEVIVHGNLKLAPPEVERKRSRGVPVGFYAAIYRDALNQLQVGGVWKHVVSDAVSAEGLRSAATAYAIMKYGKGTCISHIDMNTRTLELLRVA